MSDLSIVDFAPGNGRMDLRNLPIVMDPAEHQSIHLAVKNLASDLERVTGSLPAIWTDPSEYQSVEGAIVVGSLERSKLIRDLDDDGTTRRALIYGKWETFHTTLQDSPWSFARRILVIAGSDNRGTIFGVYTLSEQLGVSPWHWWADVPVQRRECVYALPVSTCQGEPSIQYRGLFINDEAPALTDWVHVKCGSCYNAVFYEKFFELLLRLKANFFWPAMWSGYPEPGSSFFADDAKNQETADAYGIVVSTSHHEPMQRSTTEWRRNGKGPWAWNQNKEAITDFFETGAKRAQGHESIFTLGMRGEGDGTIEADDPKATLKDVIETQRRILKDVYGKPDAVNQVMALYKEVLEYYEDGLEIPDDVTILFADDNFGNIRRLPTAEERARSGGFGLYYHLEYVGHPRSYKWINTNSCGKVQQQLRTAYDGGITKIWIVNVGDIKPIEMPATFAMQLAWDINSVGPNTLDSFFQSYSAREFGHEHADTIAGILSKHDRLMALRRHEHIEPETFSVFNYHEAETILTRFKDLERQANDLFDVIPSPYNAAFFQLVLHPVKASRIYTDLRVAQAKNRLFGSQRRNSTNLLANRALELFDEDWSLAETYHNNPWSGTKWDHIMKQTHYGYTPDSWRAPSRDLLTGLSFIQRRQDSTRIVGQMGVAVEGHAGIRPGLINEENDRTNPSRGDLAAGLTLPPLSPYGVQERYFDIFTRGKPVVEWTASVDQDWVLVEPAKGRLGPGEDDQRVTVTVNWTRAPQEFNSVLQIVVQSRGGELEHVHLPVMNQAVPPEFHGFVESEGCISLEPASVELTPPQQGEYQIYPFLGRALAGAIGLSTAPRAGVSWLEYPVYLFSTVPSAKVTLHFTMMLELRPWQRASYDLSLGGSILSSVPLMETKVEGDLPEGWSTAVQDGVWTQSHVFSLSRSGHHVLRYRPLAEGVLLEKIVVDLGGVRASYLGPPMSSRV
ncbi:hypothetical protein NCS55_00863700 [Fusarium keratoplasticum]|nr:hypothetical protein NCS55_00863700 [Fusarium keratoplasticum]